MAINYSALETMRFRATAAFNYLMIPHGDSFIHTAFPPALLMQSRLMKRLGFLVISVCSVVAGEGFDTACLKIVSHAWKWISHAWKWFRALNINSGLNFELGVHELIWEVQGSNPIFNPQLQSGEVKAAPVSWTNFHVQKGHLTFVSFSFVG